MHRIEHVAVGIDSPDVAGAFLPQTRCPRSHQNRRIAFSGKRYSAILMASRTAGLRQESARYIGTIDSHGNVLDAVHFRDGSSAESILRSLPGVTRVLPSSGLLRSLPAF